MIVTLQEARDQLQSTHSADDDHLTQLINAASEAVLTYLKLPDESSIPANATFAAKQATLILVSEFYRNREGATDAMQPGQEFGYGYLPVPVMAMLFPHRDPTFS